MKKFFVLSMLVALGLGTMTVDTAFGRPRKKSTPPPQQQPVISNVTPTALTVTDASGTRTLMFTQFTEIMVNGQKGKVADLKPGMVVSVTLSDQTHVSRVQATDKK
jgi:hypothetical protein